MVLPRIPALLIQYCKDDSSLMHKRVGQRAQIVTEVDAVRSENRVGSGLAQSTSIWSRGD